MEADAKRLYYFSGPIFKKIAALVQEKKMIRFQFSIRALFLFSAIVAFVVIVVVNMPQTPSVKDRAKVLVDRHIQGNSTGRIPWLGEFPGPRFDTYEFQSSKSHGDILLELDNLTVEGFELTRDWQSTNSGYSSTRTYTNANTGGKLCISIKRVPVYRNNNILFTWYK